MFTYKKANTYNHYAVALPCNSTNDTAVAHKKTNGYYQKCDQRVCAYCSGMIWDGRRKGYLIFTNHGIESQKWCGCNGRNVPEWKLPPPEESSWGVTHQPDESWC